MNDTKQGPVHYARYEEGLYRLPNVPENDSIRKVLLGLVGLIRELKAPEMTSVITKQIEIAETLMDTAVAWDWPLSKIVKSWEENHGKIFRPLPTDALLNLSQHHPFSFRDLDYAFGQGSRMRKHLFGGEFSCLP